MHSLVSKIVKNFEHSFCIYCDEPVEKIIDVCDFKKYHCKKCEKTYSAKDVLNKISEVFKNYPTQ